MVVNRYIGVNGGYLGDFSYRTHFDFYREFCDLDFDPNEYEGTTRERFIEILSGAEPREQAQILRGVLEKYPPGSEEIRTDEAASRITAIVQRLEGTAAVSNLTPAVSSEVVLRAIADSESLIATNGPRSAVDRTHTTVHGYLKALCDSSSIPYPDDAGVTKLLKLLRENHPALQDIGVRSDDIVKILRSFGAVLDALGPIRNRASMAHPNETLVDEAEAMLCINAARTVIQYLDAKTSG